MEGEKKEKWQVNQKLQNEVERGIGKEDMKGG